MYNKYILVLLCLAAAANIFAQSPWTKNKREGYIQLGYNGILPTNVMFYNNTNIKYTNRKVFDNNIQFYGEYGLIPNLTIMAVANAKYVATGEVVAVATGLTPEERPPALVLADGKKIGLGNSYLGGKYQFYGKGVAISANFMAMLPSSKADTVTALATGFNCYGFAPSLSVGATGGKYYFYVNGGMNFRTAKFSHEVAFTAEYGYKIKKMYLILNVHSQYNLNNRPAPEFLHTGLGVNRQNYIAIGLKAFIPVSENIGVNLSVFGAVAGNNVQAAPSFGGSVFYKWN